jgi:hypothetical protein
MSGIELSTRNIWCGQARFRRVRGVAQMHRTSGR